MKSFLKNFLSSSDNPKVVLPVSYTMVLLVGFFDFITNPEFSFSLFYLIPISLNTWYTTRKNGMFIAAMSAVTWLYVDLSSAPPYENLIAPIWNSAIRFGFFVITVYLLSEIKYLYRNLEHIVEERTSELKDEIEKKNAAERELRNSRNMYQDLVENINEVYFSTDIKGSFKYVSPNFFKTTGLAAVDGLVFYDVVLREDRTRIKQIYSAAINDKRLSVICEFRMLIDDQVFWFEQNSRILLDESGKPAEIRNLLRNVSERKAAEISLINSEMKIKKLFSDDENKLTGDNFLEVLSTPAIMKSLSERIDEITENISTRARQAIGFSSLASHELRTPLAIIRAQLEENLRSDVPISQVKETTASIYDEVLRLQRIIDDLLKLSKMEAGKFRLQKTPARLDLLLNTFFDEACMLAQEKNINVSLCVNEKISAEIDTGFFRQMLFNIFDNALKYTPRNGNIKISCSKSGTTAEIIIRDSGSGIPQSVLKKLFTPFYQNHSDENSKGTGLGLILSRWIVQLHGGTILLESANNEGTAVRIIIPIL